MGEHHDTVRWLIQNRQVHDTLLAALLTGVVKFERLARYLNGGVIHLYDDTRWNPPILEKRPLSPVKSWTVTLDDTGMVYDIPEDCHAAMIEAIEKKMVPEKKVVDA